jgi:hypothetical protein
MENLVKLTYIFLLKYNISSHSWGETIQGGKQFISLIRASLKSENYDLDILDVVEFMKKYEHE